MATGAVPDWNLWLESIWGPSYDPGAFGWIPSAASNLVFGSNPPYTVQDFLAMYPKFGGPTISPAPTGTATEGSDQLTGVSSTTGIAVGNPIRDSAGLFPDGTTVTAISGSTLTLSNEATGNGSTTLTIWNAPLIPFVVLLAYIALASSSLIQPRWLEMWPVAMSLFVAHFATLWLQSDGQGAANAAQAATQGIAAGIRVAKSVGDVSVNYQPVEGIAEFAAWNLTSYGQQLATFAKGVGMGPLFLW